MILLEYIAKRTESNHWTLWYKSKKSGEDELITTIGYVTSSEAYNFCKGWKTATNSLDNQLHIKRQVTGPDWILL